MKMYHVFHTGFIFKKYFKVFESEYLFDKDSWSRHSIRQDICCTSSTSFSGVDLKCRDRQKKNLKKIDGQCEVENGHMYEALDALKYHALTIPEVADWDLLSKVVIAQLINELLNTWWEGVPQVWRYCLKKKRKKRISEYCTLTDR